MTAVRSGLGPFRAADTRFAPHRFETVSLRPVSNPLAPVSVFQRPFQNLLAPFCIFNGPFQNFSARHRTSPIRFVPENLYTVPPCCVSGSLRSVSPPLGCVSEPHRPVSVFQRPFQNLLAPFCVFNGPFQNFSARFTTSLARFSSSTACTEEICTLYFQRANPWRRTDEQQPARSHGDGHLAPRSLRARPRGEVVKTRGGWGDPRG